ncbi:MAG TPA: protein kinase [Ktedonobacteraceae bacterium]|jgi:serine/threonine protein kinase|nr:protein kinase [Ktedonobacteraceae bacterium]
MTNVLTLAPGTVVGGHYIIGALINTGGFGAVYRGTDTSEGNRPCAIKETYDVTPAARRQALTEAAVLFTIKSDNLPQVYDAFEEHGRFYLVMQLIEGQNLLELMRQRNSPCSEQQVLKWLLPVIQVLQELHSRNPAVIHRDIKPGNIILTPDEKAVLVDFGITKLYDPNRDTQTLVRAVTEGFSPIEQYTGRTSPQSDIYSMAATMYFLLTQKVPPLAVARASRDDLIPPHLLNPMVSPHVEQAILKAMAVNADQRFESMHEFARALQQPSFAIYTDSTIANTGLPAASASTIAAPPRSTIPQYTSSPAYPPAYTGQRFTAPQPVYPIPGNGKNARRTPVPPGGVPRAASYPYHPAYSQAPAQPRQTRPVQPAVVYRSLPSPFNQGCLWGLIQGVLSALIIVALKKESYFYIAIVEGLFFYLVAGYISAHHGGSSFRGAWAGFWAGISSTVTFWLALFVALFVLLVQRIQLDANAARLQHQNLNLNIEFARAWRLVAPAFPIHPATTQQAANSGLVVYLIGGLLCAMLVGWIGGILGKARFKQRTRS